ncbi:3-hydroxyacyl-CoA dehydrogenase NAD-binding domain-containing protein [Trinickia mobilis]|uniref:3-hydroxyacyl-CoA dehydrogenase NAD-binding domain-containing protein n=1 Tax=Trinickia mobilis TaxID=2816356 RepID=UPI001A8FE793|nr:3-hydroxyacyl-CoA dehydrogenase NAD-binding domain-containing protein [Trinickia mobilis]
MSNIRFEILEGGIAVIAWDDSDRSMNVLYPQALRDFEAAVDRVSADPAIRAAIVTSDKPSFIAGADLDWFLSLQSEAARADPELGSQLIFKTLYDTSLVFRRLEKCGKPFVAAINGTALGGGFELCLACHRRIVANDESIQIGLPESKVGLFPGAGGTQRLPRMIGPLPALSLLLDGRVLSPRAALAQGLVDEVVPRESLMSVALEWARQATEADARKPWDLPGYRPPGDDPTSALGAVHFSVAIAQQRKRTLGNYPASDAILKAVYDGLLVPLDVALKIECQYLTKVMLDPVSLSMIRTQFVSRRDANKLTRRPPAPPTLVRKIGVLGAGGMMGAGIAHVAARAGLEVVLLDVDAAAAAQGKAKTERQHARAIAAGSMTPQESQNILGRMHASDDYGLLADADLVIEAVFENRDIKRDVFSRARRVMRSDAVLASNTSTLPISGLAELSGRTDDFIGLHFFSPVEKMPLVEIIKGKGTVSRTLALGMDFVRQLRKTPIVVNDSRGFYTSRVFATYVNEGMGMLSEGVNPSLIENAGRAIGMPVSPLALCDEVAIDLLYKINNQTKSDLGAKYVPVVGEDVIETMVETFKRVGRKGGAGFYDYPSEGTKVLWPELKTHFPQATVQPSFEEVKNRLLVIQSLEAARCYEERVIDDPRDADVGAVLGWNFAIWTGGPISYIDMQGVQEFVDICDDLASKYGDRFAPNNLLRGMAAKRERFYAN